MADMFCFVFHAFAVKIAEFISPVENYAAVATVFKFFRSDKTGFVDSPVGQRISVLTNQHRNVTGRISDGIIRVKNPAFNFLARVVFITSRLPYLCFKVNKRFGHIKLPDKHCIFRIIIRVHHNRIVAADPRTCFF